MPSSVGHETKGEVICTCTKSIVFSWEFEFLLVVFSDHSILFWNFQFCSFGEIQIENIVSQRSLALSQQRANNHATQQFKQGRNSVIFAGNIFWDVQSHLQSSLHSTSLTYFCVVVVVVCWYALWNGICPSTRFLATLEWSRRQILCWWKFYC